jgi:hypothetical protein
MLLSKKKGTRCFNGKSPQTEQKKRVENKVGFGGGQKREAKQKRAHVVRDVKSSRAWCLAWRVAAMMTRGKRGAGACQVTSLQVFGIKFQPFLPSNTYTFYDTYLLYPLFI